MKVFWDEAQAAHRPRFFLQRGQLRANLETHARAEALLAACRDAGLPIEMPPRAERDALLRVHDAAYLDFLEAAPAKWRAMEDCGGEIVANMHAVPEMMAQGGRPGQSPVALAGWFTADTACPVGSGTFEAACAAASLAIAAAGEAVSGRSAYALTRPPGHHAYRARAGGHCYLNNAALAAETVLAAGAPRVAVLDIDAHHGNGTQGIFWDRPDVLVASVHGDPDEYYPWFVGRASERGGPSAEDGNLNLPLPRGAGDDEWLGAIRVALERISRFGPSVIVVSLGFDASEEEPLRFLSVSEDGFARAGAAIGAAGRACALIQEGGYNVTRMGGLLQRFLYGLLG